MEHHLLLEDIQVSEGHGSFLPLEFNQSGAEKAQVEKNPLDNQFGQ